MPFAVLAYLFIRVLPVGGYWAPLWRYSFYPVAPLTFSKALTLTN